MHFQMEKFNRQIHKSGVQCGSHLCRDRCQPDRMLVKITWVVGPDPGQGDKEELPARETLSERGAPEAKC